MTDAQGSVRAWPSAVLHLDMDAFFVSVHLLDHPEDRGRPLAVGGSPQGRGVVTSASYEARRFGVRSGMAMRAALRLCPRLKVAAADWSRIRACSTQVMRLLAEYGPTEPTSIDEAYVDLGAIPAPHDLAPSIRSRVEIETGLPASAGLATSKLVAKVASERAKPGGCVVVLPGAEEGFLAPLPVRAISGIGPRTAERLSGLGIETCADLAGADRDALARRLGAHAAELVERARGLDRRTVRAGRHGPRSISAERTFATDLAEREALLAEIRHLCGRVGQRLRRHGLVASCVTVKFRWSDYTTFGRQRALRVPVDADQDIYAHAAALWLEHWPERRRVRLVGVGVTGLKAAAGRQLGLGL